MNGWKALHSFGIGSTLQHRFVAPVGHHLTRVGQVVLPRKLHMELNAGGATVPRSELHPGVLLVFHSRHVIFNSIGLLAVVAAVALSLNNEWRATVAQHVLHFMSSVDTSAASANPSPATMTGVQPVAFAPTAPSIGASAAQAVTPATAQSGMVAAAGWDALSKVPSMVELAAQIPNTQVVHDARESATAGTSREQAAMAEYIAHKHRVAATATGQLVKATYQTGKEVGLDPLLILGVMAIEPSFNPFAESGMGVQGLMQVMTKVHQDEYEAMGGVGAALNSYANIKVGALVLKDCIARAGSIEGGLKLYVGVVTQGDGGYDGKVLQERSRLCMVATGYRPSMTVVSEREPVKPVATAAPVAQIDVKTQAAKPTDRPALRQQEEARLDSKSQGQA